jgi:hypothetical protein
VHALFELEFAIWLQAGEDRARRYCGGQPSRLNTKKRAVAAYGMPAPSVWTSRLRPPGSFVWHHVLHTPYAIRAPRPAVSCRLAFAQRAGRSAAVAAAAGPKRSFRFQSSSPLRASIGNWHERGLCGAKNKEPPGLTKLRPLPPPLAYEGAKLSPKPSFWVKTWCVRVPSMSKTPHTGGLDRCGARQEPR